MNESIKVKSKSKQRIRQGRIYIRSSYNNTIITVTDLQGNVLIQGSSGQVGFSGTRKATPYAAQKAVAQVLERLKPFGLEEATMYVTGIGSARESAVRAFNVTGLTITSIRDITPIPHNGIRPPKKRPV